MKAHSITTNMSDGAGELVALSFESGQIAVTWGSGWVSTTSVYQWMPDSYGGAWHFVHGGRCEAKASGLEVQSRSVGPSITDFQRWLHEQANAIRRDQSDKLARALQLRTVGNYGAEAQAEWRALDYDHTLPTSVLGLSGNRPRARALASWLATVGARLTSGVDLYAFGEQHHASIVYPQEIDRLIYVAVELGLVKPYDYDPVPGTFVGESDGLLSKAQQSAWRKHGKGPWGKGSMPVGAQFWTFTQGPNYAELSDVLPVAVREATS